MQTDHSTGIRNDHLLWIVGAIILSVVLFFPSSSESEAEEITQPAPSERETPSAIERFAESAITYARGEAVSIPGVSGEEETGLPPQTMETANTTLFASKSEPVASAELPDDVFKAGEVYTARTLGCGGATNCARR